MYRLWLATVLLFAACTPGTVTDTPEGEGELDSGAGPNTPDAFVSGRPDAMLGRPDAMPERPDAAAGAPDAASPEPPDAAAPDAGIPPDGDLASGVSIAKVSLYQTVEIPLAVNGSAVSSRNASVVAGADAMVGVFVDSQTGFTSRQITATVYIDGVANSQTKTISGDSGPNPMTSGFAIRVSGDEITSGASFYVELTEAVPGDYSGSTSGARYPSSGGALLGADSSNGPLELVIVPFRYNADGSGRLPPTDADALDSYRRGFLALYPVGEVKVTVRSPVTYNSSIGAGSSAQWSAWLETLVDVRASDGPNRNVYYYGVAAPTSSYGTFCSSGCIAGLGYVPGSSSSSLFAAVGVSFSGSVNVATGLHEVGHNMGRSHAPCGGVSSSDPSFPYGGGKIGVWGWSSVTDTMMDPSAGTDIMGYCNSQWISDYTYQAIFRRIAQVNNSARWAAPGAPRRYRMANVDERGRVTWRKSLELSLPPMGDAWRVTFLDGTGGELGEVAGEFFAFDHIDGGTLFVPEPDPTRATSATRVRIEGIDGELAW